MSPELVQRAACLGLHRDPQGRWWFRRGPNLVARADAGHWWWAPETWAYADVVRHAPRFDAEADALTAALDWIEAGEPAIEPVTP